MVFDVKLLLFSHGYRNGSFVPYLSRNILLPLLTFVLFMDILLFSSRKGPISINDALRTVTNSVQSEQCSIGVGFLYVVVVAWVKSGVEVINSQPQCPLRVVWVGGLHHVEVGGELDYYCKTTLGTCISDSPSGNASMTQISIVIWSYIKLLQVRFNAFINNTFQCESNVLLICSI